MMMIFYALPEPSFNLSDIIAGATTIDNNYLTIDFNKDYNFLNIFLISNKLELIRKFELTNTNIHLNLPKHIKIFNCYIVSFCFICSHIIIS